jgi:4'-phosphopantetheinyl transferase
MAPPEPGEIDLWCWNLDITRDRLAVMAATLSPDERERRDRFYFARDANRFVAARGQLRTLLADYLCRDAHTICFEYNQYGKPRLKADADDPPIGFNLTHSDSMASLAVATGYEVGVDIERIRPMGEDLARWVMNDDEQCRFRSLPPGLQTNTFFRCWTRKEAVLKAAGVGLSRSPRCIEVPFGIGTCVALLHDDDDRASAIGWQVTDFVPAQGYAGAVAARRQSWTLRVRQLQVAAVPGADSPGPVLTG